MTDVITHPVPRGLAPFRGVCGGTVEIVEGRAAVLRLLPEYDRLAVRCRLPVTARHAWLRAQLAVQPEAAPWAVVLRAADGGMRAAALLLDRFDDDPARGCAGAMAGRGAARTALAGGGEGYRAGVAVLDPASAADLGTALATELERRPGRRELELGPLADDETTGWLAGALGAEVVACDPVPWVRSAEGPEVTAYLSHGLRKTLRKARNRLVTDGLDHDIRFTSDPQRLIDLLPAMEQAYRDRDRSHGLPCLLDTAEGLRLWRGRVQGLMDAGCLEVATLTVNGRLAAYVLGVRDRDRYGVLEGRFVTALSRYAPGRMLEAAVLQRVLTDDGFVGLDWMTGVAPETLLAANDVDSTVLLRRPAVAMGVTPRTALAH
jgi:Acetyltransferase (GNAT) domain